MDSFELISEDDYEKIYLSKKFQLRIVKTNGRCIVVSVATESMIAEFVNAEDSFINDRIKQMIKGV